MKAIFAGAALLGALLTGELLTGAVLTGALAQSGYPDKPIKILVGFTPGVAPDISSRLIGDKFTEVWGKPVVVENVTGAGGNIATDRAAKSAPDGYTLLMGGNASIVFNASLMKLPYDPIGDFAPITQVFIAANVLAIPPEIPAKTIPELVAYAKANPGKLTYGHAGVGTSQHLGGELFKFITKTDIQPVAYRGSTAIMPDLIAGRVSMCFCNVVNVLPLAREGKLRIFAVTSKKRSAAAPDLPTMIEAGFPDFDVVPWFGLMAPAGTPPEIIGKVHRETVKILAMPDVRKKLEELGLDVIGNTPKEFAELIKTEIPQWGAMIKAAGIKLNE